MELPFVSHTARTEERRVMEDLRDEDGILELDIDGTDKDPCMTELVADGVVAADVNTATMKFFGLWSVYVPPSSLGPVGQSIVPGTISRGSLGCRDRLPAERDPGTRVK